MEKEEQKGRGDNEEEEEGGEGKRESERRGGEWGQNRERGQKKEEVQEQQNPLISKPETSHNILPFFLFECLSLLLIKYKLLVSENNKS